MSELINVDDSTFNSHLNDQKAIIVDFWSPTCRPCISLEPGLKQIAASYESKVKILKVNVNENPRTSARFLIRGLPTLLFIKNGSVKSQIVGAVNPTQIEKKLQEVM